MKEDKVKAIFKWPEPRNIKETQLFLGLANYYRKFIKGYSKIAELLTNLTKKDLVFYQIKKTQKAFNKLKKRFISRPVLITFDLVKKIGVETDLLDKAIGAEISQPDNKERMHLVVFYSRKLTLAELNYNIYNKELLVIVAAFKKQRVYLKEAIFKVQVYSNNKNLTRFTTIKELN